LQPLDVVVAPQEPQQFDDDRFEVDLFGGDQREAFRQVKAHLVAKHAARAGARAIGFEHARGVDVAHEIFELAAHGAVCEAHGLAP